MDTIEKTDFLKDILILLRETFEGSPEGQGSVYLDRGIGFLPTIDRLSAAEASRDANGTTAVAHTEHAKFYLDRLVELMRGSGEEKINWEQSWLIETVSDDEWNALRNAVRQAYERALLCFANIKKWDQDNIGDAVAIIAHTAYHLGAMRQMIKSAAVSDVVLTT